MHSKLQIEVLKLYKELLRAAVGKPGFKDNIRQEFRKQSSLPRHETLRIEYQMRMGRRKIDLIRDPNTADMGKFVDQ